MKDVVAIEGATRLYFIYIHTWLPFQLSTENPQKRNIQVTRKKVLWIMGQLWGLQTSQGFISWKKKLSFLIGFCYVLLIPGEVRCHIFLAVLLRRESSWGWLLGGNQSRSEPMSSRFLESSTEQSDGAVWEQEKDDLGNVLTKKAIAKTHWTILIWKLDPKTFLWSLYMCCGFGQRTPWCEKHRITTML